MGFHVLDLFVYDRHTQKYTILKRKEKNNIMFIPQEDPMSYDGWGYYYIEIQIILHHGSMLHNKVIKFYDLMYKALRKKL